MPDRIEPRLLKGFRDFLPGDERERLRIAHLLQQVFSSFGFEPIDTPVLEYTEILLGKGGGDTDKQVYRFDDQGGRDVAMRYDLTVPFARYMAQHLNELPLPFKRYHIAKVFRGENTQRGRYREFTQCDFDIVGSDSASADLEIILLMDQSFRSLGVPDVRIHLAHRAVFNRLLDSLGVGDDGVEVLRTVDKMRKIGADEVQRQLRDLTGADAAATILAFVAGGEDNTGTIRLMRELVPGAESAIRRLESVLDASSQIGVADRLVIDPSITRGLDYYTGIVFESFLTRLPEIGSVCSGGRYDNLASLYSKERLPGVGASIGLDRLMAGLAELGIEHDSGGAADAVIACTDEQMIGAYHLVAGLLRKQGLRIDVFPDAKKPGQQYAIAEKKGISAAVTVSAADSATDHAPESAKLLLNVRNLATRTDTADLSVEDAAAAIRAIVSGS